MPTIAGPTRGCRGVVTVSSTASGSGTAVGRLTNWSFAESAEEIDASVMGSCVKAYLAGAQSTSVDIEAQWDGDDTVQNLITIGSRVYVRIYPEGTGSGANFYRTQATSTGGMTVLGRSVEGGGVDGIVSIKFNGRANGGLTATAVP